MVLTFLRAEWEAERAEALANGEEDFGEWEDACWGDGIEEPTREQVIAKTKASLTTALASQPEPRARCTVPGCELDAGHEGQHDGEMMDTQRWLDEQVARGAVPDKENTDG